jgi:hypothetical protein
MITGASEHSYLSLSQGILLVPTLIAILILDCETWR